eukprot:TRINITY_DN6474_c0_g1_i2.p1 TRINITY_DN6474_c0_g1~~TRINITY_DN6474_c0_g1_i2.p1  ORF type:complete len:316 (-),score=54.65 TRINITY_DN6474_c0_g1_i2:20-967(-)
MHYKGVNCLRFTDDGLYIISGGQDGLVQVWSITSLASSGDGPIKPQRVWSSHSLPVTDIHVGIGGSRSHVYTCSLDRTCKIFDLASGVMIRSMLIPSAANCCVTDCAENVVYIGAFDGNIYQFDFSGFVAQNQSMSDSTELSHAFVGQGSPITTIALSMDSTILITGTSAGVIDVWDVASRQVTRVIKHHKGEITNMCVLFRPESLPSSEESTRAQDMPINSLKKFRDPDGEHKVNIRLRPTRSFKVDLTQIEDANGAHQQERMTSAVEKSMKRHIEELESNLKSLRSEQKGWQDASMQMYEMCVDATLSQLKKS